MKTTKFARCGSRLLICAGLTVGSMAVSADEIQSDAQTSDVQISGNAPPLTASNLAATSSNSGTSSGNSSAFSPAILYFASQYQAPRWGSNSAALALNSQITQTVVQPQSNPTPVPLPGAAFLLLSGVGGLLGVARKRGTRFRSSAF